MKELTLFDRKIKIPSPKEIKNWDSGFERELYEFCFDFIPDEGVYKPYLDVDRFVDKHRDFYKFNLKERMMFYGLEIDKDDSLCFGNKPFALLLHGMQEKGSEAGEALKLIKRNKKLIIA